MIDYRLFKFHTDDKIPGQKSKLISMGPPLRPALPQAPRPQPIPPAGPLTGSPPRSRGWTGLLGMAAGVMEENSIIPMESNLGTIVSNPIL